MRKWDFEIVLLEKKLILFWNFQNRFLSRFKQGLMEQGDSVRIIDYMEGEMKGCQNVKTNLDSSRKWMHRTMKN